MVISIPEYLLACRLTQCLRLFSAFFTLSPTLNFSIVWASPSPDFHITYITSVFLPCALLARPCSTSPISPIFLSSFMPPHSQGLVHSADLLSLWFPLFSALADASGCTSAHIYKRNLPLNHTLEWPCPRFLHWQLARPLCRRDESSDHDGPMRDRTTPWLRLPSSAYFHRCT